jgi:pilus assembly protein FimV
VAKKINHTARNLSLRTSVLAVASALTLATLPVATEAAGLGKVNVFSALGQPLRAELEVFATREELAGMKAQLASQDAFKQAGVDFAPSLSGITLVVDKRPNGQAIIRLTSTKPINDPFVDLLLELNWPTGRLIREYTFLLDPPEFASKATGAAAPAIARPVAVARQTVDTRPLEDKPARPAPYRGRASESVQKPMDGGSTYEVRRGETLGKIASELRPEGVSLDQMLLALFRANQDAFDHGNINRLKAGKILSVPDKAALESIPREEAKTVIAAQSSDWGAYRRKLAGVAGEFPSRDEAPRQQAAGKITTRVEDRAGPSSEPKDQLKVSKTDLGGVKPLPASRRTDEDLIAKEKALKDANERLASLERNVAELQRLVELKSQTLADLERQAAGKTAPVAEVRKAPEEPRPANTAPLPAPTASAVPAPVKAEPPPAAATGVAAAKPADQTSDGKPAEALAKPEEVKPEVKVEVAPPPPPPQPAELPKPKPVVVTPPEEPGFIEDLLGSTAFLAGGGAIAALLAAYWLAKRRRPSDAEVPLGTTSTLSPLSEAMVGKSVFHSAGGQSVDTSDSMVQTDFSQAGPGSIDTDEVDPVAEADVYMAYGRDAQAEEILLEAKQKDPRRYAIHLKLLEIYLNRQDLKPFAKLATELHDATGGVGAEWEKAVAMGLQLDPSNPLYGAAAQTAPALRDAALAGAAAAALASQDTLVKSPARPPEVPALVDVPAVPTAVAWSAAEEAKLQPSDLADLDFDLGSSEPAPRPPAPVDDGYLETTLSFPNTVEGDALDFDLADSSSPPSIPAGAQAPGPQLVDDATALAVTMLVGADSLPSAPEPGVGLDFEFDLGQEVPGESNWGVTTLTRAEPEEEVLDIGSPNAEALDEALEFDVRLTESTVLGEAMQHPAFDMSSISLDLAEPEVEDRAATPPPSVTPSLTPEFSFEADQEDTLVNPNFSVQQSQTEPNSVFDFATASDVGPESLISSSEEVATKMDLARAYQEMGDIEGARELLQEVANEGDGAQREAARALLAGLRD